MLASLSSISAEPVGQLPSSRPSSFNIGHFSDSALTPKTIDAMHRAVLQAKTDAEWRRLMEDIRRQGRGNGDIGWKDYLGEVKFFNNHYRNVMPLDYIRDPQQVELVKHPFLTLQAMGGDCDDLSVVWCASLGAIGAPHRFRTYKADPTRPQEWSHVVGQVWVPGNGWINNDLTIKGAEVGFEPVGYETKDWPEPRW